MAASLCAADVADMPRWSVWRYKHVLGWPVAEVDRSAVLSCDGSVAALPLPSSWAGEVTHRLVLAQVRVPVLAVAGRHPRWLIVASSGGATAVQPMSSGSASAVAMC